MDSNGKAEVVDIYQGLLHRDRRAEADLVAQVVRLLAPDMRLSPMNPSGGEPTNFSAVDFSSYSAEQLAATAARSEERDYAEYCRLMGVEGY